jgi:hypothetical protein
VSAHDLRRGYITLCAKLVPHYVLKRLINHSMRNSVDVTAGYVQLSVDDLRPHAPAVADRLMQLCGVEPVGGENVAALR